MAVFIIWFVFSNTMLLIFSTQCWLCCTYMWVDVYNTSETKRIKVSMKLLCFCYSKKGTETIHLMEYNTTYIYNVLIINTIIHTAHTETPNWEFLITKGYPSKDKTVFIKFIRKTKKRRKDWWAISINCILYCINSNWPKHKQSMQ